MVTPFVGTQALAIFQGQVVPLVLTGIVPEQEEKMSKLSTKLLTGNLNALSHFGMIVGRGLADQLGVQVGDQITLMLPEANTTLVGMIPRFKRFTIQGVFSVGTGFNFDAHLAFINLHDAQVLLHLGNDVTGLKLKIQEVYAAPQLADTLQTALGEPYEVGSWVRSVWPLFPCR